MNRFFYTKFILVPFLICASGLFGIGEKTFSIGSVSGWKNIENRAGLAELPDQRPSPVLALSSVPAPADYQPDLHLTFDEGNPARFRDSAGHYDLFVSEGLYAADLSLAMHGSGAARFVYGPSVPAAGTKEEGPLVLRPGPGALFGPGNHIRDFTIEFWLYPANPENSEQILDWYSALISGPADYKNQRIQCVVSRNRLQWTFSNFFVDPQKKVPADLKTVTFTGTPVIPKTWSHHLVRFDADYGLLEYLVDGRQEVVMYTTSSGREGGQIYTPIIGEDCSLAIGSRYSGLIDEFRIYPVYLDKPVLTKYPLAGGRAESRTIDLGSVQNRLLGLEASGGRIVGTVNGKNEYTGAGNFKFPDHSEMRFYVRFSNAPYQWDMPWIPVVPGAGFPESFRGRYVKIAVEFFPSGNGETTPYLEEVRLIYRNIEVPPPPGYLTAIARDGAVELSWRGAAHSNLGGYLVYFGTSAGEYFGANPAYTNGVFPGNVYSSPLDAGNKTSIRIEGLRNGTLYYFAVASYDKSFREPGDFSREIAARPQKEFQVLP